MAEIKNLKKASERICLAAQKKEKVIIYSDTDMDGVGSAIILKETLKNLGLEPVDIYFPDREVEGYGITEPALVFLKKYAPALLVSLDCGIGNYREVDLANKMGFEVVIIDHHQPLDIIPKASIIVDPKQKGDEYPFKEFANVGITYKLCSEILKDKLTEGLRQDFLQFAALATIADMMPRTDDNEAIIMEGLGYIKSSWRPGIKTLLEVLSAENLNLLDTAHKINSFLNIRSVGRRLPISYELLTALDEKTARELAEDLFEKGLEKKERIRLITEEVKERIAKKTGDPIFFEGDKNWELVLLGVVASSLSQEYKKPVFLYRVGDDASHGSIRTPSGFNVVDAMKTCSDMLITYGGHPQAAGFKLSNEQVENFKKCLFEYYKGK